MTMITLSTALVLTTLMGTYILGLASLSYWLPENPGKKVTYAKAQHSSDYMNRSCLCYEDKC